MRYLGIAIGALIMVCGIVPSLFVKERYYHSTVVQNQERIGLFTSLRMTFSNRAFVILCLLIVFFLLGTALYDGYGRYVGTYYVLHGDWDRGAIFAGYGTLVYTVFSLSFIPIFRVLSMRIGKPRCLSIAVSLVLVSAVSTWWTFTPDWPWAMLINTAFIGMGYAGLWLMIPSMQVDVVDLDELKTGQRREGSFAAAFSWVLKLSFCMGFLLTGPMLELTGFDASLQTPQPDAVLTRMRLGFLILPIVGLIVALALIRLFPIKPNDATRIRGQLESRRGTI